MQPWPATTAVATVPWPRNERGALAGLKTTSYAENVVALADAKRRGASEAVFANLAGHLCEGTGTNVFYVVDGELRTPTLASGCLAGVTRALILEWFGGREVDEPIEVVAGADEVFLASTTRDVQARLALGRPRAACPGPVTAEALATWRRREPELLGVWAHESPGDVNSAGSCARVSLRSRRGHAGDWRSGSALRSHRRGHWFEPSIAHQSSSQVRGRFPDMQPASCHLRATPAQARGLSLESDPTDEQTHVQAVRAILSPTVWLTSGQRTFGRSPGASSVGWCVRSRPRSGLAPGPEARRRQGVPLHPGRE